MKRSHIVVFLKLAVGLSMLAFVVGSSNWKHLFGVLGSARITHVAMAFTLLFCTYLIGVIRWQVLLGALTARLPLFLLGRLSLIGLFFNTFVPGGLAGDIVRGYHLGSEGFRRSDALASVVADRFIGLIGLLTVSLVGFWVGHRELMASNLLGLFLAIALGLVGAVVLFYSGWVSYPVGLLTERLSTSAYPIRNLWDAIQSYRMCGREVASALALTFGADLLMIISVYVLAQSIRVALPFHYFLVFVPVIAILSAVPISINGVGVREAGYLLLFTQVGLSQEQAVSISLLYFGMTLVLGALGGGAYLLQALISPSVRVSLHSKGAPVPSTSASSPRTRS